jgi:hypothetical protein
MVQMVNLCAFMGCKPAQASTIDVYETGFFILANNPASLTSQTELENLGRNKHCYPSPWPWQ